MKKILFLIPFFLFTLCGPSDEEIALQKQCDFLWNEITRIREFWKEKGSFEVILADKNLAIGYRDDISSIELMGDEFITNCEEIEGTLVFSVRDWRYQAIKHRAYISGYLDAKEIYDK